MRSLILLVMLGGCSSRFDESSLIGGAQPGRDMGGGGTMQVPPADLMPVAQGPTPLCTDFSDTPIGALPLGWTEARGTWRVALDGATRVLRQEADPPAGSGSQEFLAWTGNMSQRDLELSVMVTSQGHHNDECVVIRYQSTQTYYALCLDSPSDSPTPTEWQLTRKNGGGGGGGGNTLDSGPLATLDQPTHLLSLRVVGNKLLPTVDGVAKNLITDDAIAQGGFGLLSESKGRFTQVCVSGL